MDRNAVQEALKQIKAIKGDNLFYDLHAHPIEIMYDGLYDYLPSNDIKGLFSAGPSSYVRPEPAAIGLEQTGKPVAASLQKKFNLLNARRYFAHTGSKVFSDEMEMCALDRVLLLSVVDTEESGNGQIELLTWMFDADERFMFAYCLPNDIPNHLVAAEVKKVCCEYSLAALKIHPSITGIDASKQAGIDRIEAILDASRQCQLNVVIHGGLSPDCKNSQAVSYGTIEKLQYVDWSITPQKVDIAHGGFFGNSLEDARDRIAPIMAKLLDQHENLVVDTSGIGYTLICLMIEHFDPNRIVFGSDALYIKQWMAMVQLWAALKATQDNHESTFLRIVSENPEQFFKM